MNVDVRTEILIHRPPEQVAAFACAPENAPRWYVNIKDATWETAPPLGVGSRFAFVAHFLGRRIAYTYEVVAHEPGRHLAMRTAEGPFPMRTEYGFEPAPEGTRMTLRNSGSPSGFAALGAPVMSLAMRRANQKDLAMLKAVLEG